MAHFFNVDARIYTNDRWLFLKNWFRFGGKDTWRDEEKNPIGG